MSIRWDFGSIYKMIRQAKGLTQAQVCGEEMSRTSLAKIEANKAVPNFENMIFLLEQVNMSLEEFKYICNHYKPSLRQEIFNKVYHILPTMGNEKLEDIKKLCEEHLNSQHDIPIERILDLVTVVINVRKHGFLKPNEELQAVTTKIWNYLEKQDDWFERDFKLLSTILFIFPIETIKETTERILASLEKYRDYHNINSIKYTLLANLSSIFLYHDLIEDCERLTLMIDEMAKETKRYDQLAFAQIRLGICRQQQDLIDKGLTLLELVEEKELLNIMTEELKQLNPWAGYYSGVFSCSCGISSAIGFDKEKEGKLWLVV